MPVQFAVAEDLKLEPEPGQSAQQNGQKRRGRPPGSTTGGKVENQLKDELTMLLKLGSMAWAVKDPICGPVLNQQAELIAADIARFAAKQKWARKYLERVADLGELIPFVIHVQPVVLAIYAHHIAPQPEPQPAE